MEASENYCTVRGVCQCHRVFITQTSGKVREYCLFSFRGSSLELRRLETKRVHNRKALQA